MNKKFYLIFSNVFLVMNFAFLISTNTNAQTVKINVTPSPNLCIGDSMTLKRTISGFAPSTTTTYYKNDTLIFTGDIYGKGNLKLTDAAWYKVKVVDQTNQSRVDSIFISVNLLPKYDSITIDKIKTCGGQGSIIVWGLKDTTEYTLSFKYNNGADSFFNIKSDANGKLTKNMLLAGKYSNIQVKLNNCTSNVSPNTVDLVDPPLPITSLTIKQELCKGDTITFIGSPVNGTLKVISGDGTVTSNGTKLTTTPNGVTPIIIEYSFKDPTTKCTGITRDTIMINQLPMITAVVDSVNCFGGNDGKINISPNIYSYSWSISPLSGSMPSNLKAANYAVTATDLKGCKYSLPSIVVSEPAALVSSKVQNRVICFNSPETGSIDVNGGTPYYTFSWMGPNGSGNSKDIIYSKGGDYFLTITDFNNCILKDTIMITENSEIQFTVESEPSNKHFCDGEKITLFATGDAGFIWENGPSDKIFEVFETGTYRVTGTKMENGYPCSINKTISVVKDTLPIINFRSSKGIKDTIFYICKSDSLEITAIDNIGGYTFKWDNGNLDGFRTLIQNKSYSVTVSDKNTGCVANSKLDLKYYETIDIQIHLLNDDLSFPDSSILCFSDNPYLNLESNGTFSGSLFSYFNIDWSSNNPEVVVEKINSNKEARIKYGNSNFIIYLEARERTQSCFSKDSIQITIQSPQTNIVEENYCGVILLKDDYVLNEPLPPNITNLNNGFYYVQGIAKLSYTFKKDCSDTMAMPIINDLSGDKFINDDLIYDECGPFLLAKEKEGVCYTWYEINKQSKKPTLLTGKEDSWLKLNSSIDVENNTYIAIIHDCSDICDSTVIFTRSDESGKTIPCYNSGESAIKIYPNPNQGHMYLKLEGLPAGKQEVFIYDMMGRQVYKKTIDHTGNNDITELSLTHLPDGIYFAKTYYNGTGISTKFIITH